MFRVQADRLDDEVEFVGAVDLARYAVGHTGPKERKRQANRGLTRNKELLIPCSPSRWSEFV